MQRDLPEMDAWHTVSETAERTYEWVTAALMCAVIGVLSQVALPMPSGVPVTLQTFAVALCAYLLETRFAVLSVTAYVLLGLVGVPVYANFGAGPGKLFGLSGGFLWGFILFALCTSLAARSRKTGVRILFGIIGLLICHLCGVCQFAALTDGGFAAALLLVSLPYLWKDILFVVLAYLIAGRLRPILAKIRRE